jgi:MGT family glycosyltransferase
MSRILIASIQVTGHVLPALPIARVLVERGHEVWFYTGAKFRAKVEATGATYLPMSPQYDYDDSKMSEVFPERDRLKGLSQLKFDLKHAFIDAARGQLADLEPVIQRLQPDLMLTDPAFTGGMPLRYRFDIPLVLYGILPLTATSRDTAPYGLALLPDNSPLGRLRNRALNWFSEKVVMGDVQRYAANVMSELGVPNVPFHLFDFAAEADLFLQFTDEAFEYPRSDLKGEIHFVGPILPSLSMSDFTPPSWWAEMIESRKPVVHVTQGTLATDSAQLIRPTLQALADEDVLVIVATGGKPAESIGMDPLPANARVEPFIPYGPFLPHVDVMVTNGGYGGVHLALANGIPLVVAGASEDKPEVANRVAWSGVGLNLKTGRPTPAQIKSAMRRILSDPTYREHARQMQARFLSHDAPNEAADLMEALIARWKAKATVEGVAAKA